MRSIYSASSTLSFTAYIAAGMRRATPTYTVALYGDPHSSAAQTVGVTPGIGAV